jgi:hypothetical protein
MSAVDDYLQLFQRPTMLQYLQHKIKKPIKPGK